jgi:hypothetical protein
VPADADQPFSPVDQAATGPDRLWSTPEITAHGVVLTVAGSGLSIAASRVTRAGRIAAEQRWLLLGVFCVLLERIAVAACLASGARRLVALRRELLPQRAPRPDAGVRPQAADTVVVWVARSFPARWFHRQDCAMLEGKDVEPRRMTAPLTPCGICRPGTIEQAGAPVRPAPVPDTAGPPPQHHGREEGRSARA